MSLFRMLFIIKILLLGLSVSLPLACSSKAQAPSGNGKRKAVETNDDDDDDDVDCVADNGAADKNTEKDEDKKKAGDDEVGDNGEDDEDGVKFDLTSPRYSLKSLNYSDDFKSDFKSDCVSCHAKGNKAKDSDKDYDCSDPGTAKKPVAIDFSDMDSIKKNFDKIIDRMKASDDCKMPPTGSSDIDIDDFEKWGDDGFALGEDEETDDKPSDGSSKSAEKDDETTVKPGCGKPLPSGDDDGDDDDGAYKPDSAFFKEFLNPAELEACKSKGKLFRRSKLECIEEYEVASTCDDAWIEANTSWTAANLKAEVEKQQSVSGIFLDQCGFKEDKVYLLYYCPSLETKGKCVTPKEVEDADSKSVFIRDFNAQVSLHKK